MPNNPAHNSIERIEYSPFEDVIALVREVQSKGGRVIALFFHDGEKASDGVTFTKVYTPKDVDREEMRSVVASSVSIFGHLDLLEDARKRGLH